MLASHPYYDHGAPHARQAVTTVNRMSQAMLAGINRFHPSGRTGDGAALLAAR